MDPISGDSRFSKLAKDKKFLSVSKKHKKVKIDKRFQSLFTSEKFVNKCSVDKRGRPKSLSAKENYEKFYDLDDSDTSDSDDEVNDGSENSAEEDSNIHQPETNVGDDETILESDIKTKLLSSSVDYARGEADLYSDSSSEEDADSDEEEEQKEEEEHEYFDKWGELDGEAERTEEATDRLAVCNMDWDRVGAEDIFLVLSSFCPASGSVTSVQVFLSDFGKERMEEEKTLGPKELRQLKGENNEDDDGLVVDKKKALKEAAAAMDRVRQYQVARLKYYYAVVQFDCVESASRVYTECDGMEYELSATRVDLRYIPPAMTFDTPSSSCLTPPHPDKYQPKTFFTTALQQGKVELTWDEANLDRVKALKDAYSKMEEGEELENMADLIASASEDEDEGGDKKEGSEEEPDNDKDTISKYRALLVGIGGKDEKSAEGNMEVTWNDEDRAEESQEEATPWEKYLQRKKDKKRKKTERIDVDDVPEGVDMSDPFFADEIGEEEQSKKKKKKKKKMNDILDENEDSNELALMVMDSDDEKEHFNFKDIVESETKSGKSKKKKWKKKKKEVEIPTEDNFSVDVTDDRFSSLFSRPEFNIDPTEPNFKKTKNMEKIIQEKQKRIDKTITTEAVKVEKKLKLDPEVSSSLKSVKNKWKKNAKKGKTI